MTAIVLQGDARRLPLPDGSVDLVVTSPPYFGLRSYTDGGEHYDGQIGSEATPQEWVTALIECTAEWIRVLKPSGSIFVNLGDKYATSLYRGNPMRMPNKATDPAHRGPIEYVGGSAGGARDKSLLGLPWRYALAATDQLGLILRRDIIWAKPNGLPESVTDRCRSSHEYLFHLVKQPRYYAAVDEIREPHAPGWEGHASRRPQKNGTRPTGVRATFALDGPRELNPLGKLPGSVWTIPSQPLTVPPELGVDHFAAFPMELPRRCILGWSPPGICVACGEGRRPVVDTEYGPHWKGGSKGRHTIGGQEGTLDLSPRLARLDTITGYECGCGTWPVNAVQPSTRPATVLDPFGGTGTTALVASMHGRTGISVDRSADYTRLATWRTHDPAERAKALQVPKPPPVPDGMEPLFAI